jgi:hypothetical protein
MFLLLYLVCRSISILQLATRCYTLHNHYDKFIVTNTKLMIYLYQIIAGLLLTVDMQLS